VSFEIWYLKKVAVAPEVLPVIVAVPEPFVPIEPAISEVEPVLIVAG